MKSFSLLLAVSVFLLALPDPLQAALPDPLERANQTIQGLFHYYWSRDPTHVDAQFFFACGQIGGGGGQPWNSCACITPGSCVSCYRWWDAVGLESVATFGIYTGSKAYLDSPDHVFNHSPYNSRWNATLSCTFMDDFSWYGIAYLRVYEWTKVKGRVHNYNGIIHKYLYTR